MTPPTDVSAPPRASRPLIDIASDMKTSVRGTLDKVGMSRIEMPLCMAGEEGLLRQIPALIDAYVDLAAPEVKGIHMSRLFLLLQERLPRAELSPALLGQVLEAFVESHEGLSSSAYISLSFEHLTLRPALKSDYEGYRSYPIEIHASMREGVASFGMSAQVMYSSTCPCSAALARQLIQEAFRRDFAGRDALAVGEVEAWLSRPESICATPHSQRSRATVTVELAPEVDSFPFMELIDRLEACLATPVQAAVKRADEQEFARLNGRNLMFCEDAARRMKHALNACEAYRDFRIEARHMESLHPHDAVAYATKSGHPR